MATITIKIESEELAREVLTQMGYLPCDDIPDLVSVESDEEPEEPAVKEPEEPKAPVVKEPRFAPKTESSRDVFAKEQINKVLMDQGLLPPVEEEVWCPEPNDEGFGTPIDQTGAIDLGLGDLKDGLMEVIDRIQKRKGQEMKDVAESISMGLRLPKLKPEQTELELCIEPNDEGFGTPIDETMEKFDVVNSESKDDAALKDEGH